MRKTATLEMVRHFRRFSKGGADLSEFGEMVALQKRFDALRDYEVKFTCNGRLWLTKNVTAEGAHEALKQIEAMHDVIILEAKVSPK